MFGRIRLAGGGGAWLGESESDSESEYWTRDMVEVGYVGLLVMVVFNGNTVSGRTPLENCITALAFCGFSTWWKARYPTFSYSLTSLYPSQYRDSLASLFASMCLKA